MPLFLLCPMCATIPRLWDSLPTSATSMYVPSRLLASPTAPPNMKGCSPTNVNCYTSHDAHRSSRAHDSAAIAVACPSVEVQEALAACRAVASAQRQRGVADRLDADAEDGIGDEDQYDICLNGVRGDEAAGGEVRCCVENCEGEEDEAEDVEN